MVSCNGLSEGWNLAVSGIIPGISGGKATCLRRWSTDIYISQTARLLRWHHTVFLSPIRRRTPSGLAVQRSPVTIFPFTPWLLIEPQRAPL